MNAGLTWNLSDSSWATIAEAVRLERKKHQTSGGTSKLAKNGTTYTMTAEGLTAEVFMSAIKKIVQPVLDREGLRDLMWGRGAVDDFLGGLFGNKR